MGHKSWAASGGSLVTGKPLGERVARLEGYYVESAGHFKEIKEHLAKQNDSIASIRSWQQRVIGGGVVLGLIVAATAGTLITLLAT